MTNAVKFADKLSSRNIGIIVADHGDKVEGASGSMFQRAGPR